MTASRPLPPFAVRHRLWVWVKARQRSLGSYHLSMLLTWAVKAQLWPPSSLVASVVVGMERGGSRAMQAQAAGKLYKCVATLITVEALIASASIKGLPTAWVGPVACGVQ